MGISTTSGSKLFIAGQRLAATDTAAEFAALTWVEIELVSNLGEFGREHSEVSFDVLSNEMTMYAKGNYNNGVLPVVCGWDPLATGQIALRAAAATKFEYAFKVEAADKLDANDTSSIFYFHALVMGCRRVQGGANDVVQMNASLRVTTNPVEVPATVVT